MFRLIVGLQNPGVKYQGTRHNIGGVFTSLLAAQYEASVPRKKFHALFSDVKIEGNPLWLEWPETYMNLSGKSVQEISNFYKISPEEILVVQDELDLPVGKIRIKQGGGAGGHNGIKSIDAAIGPNYYRLRIGIDRPPHEDTASYVLGHFTQEERKKLEPLLVGMVEEFPFLLSKGTNFFMSEVARKIAL